MPKLLASAKFALLLSLVAAKVVLDFDDFSSWHSKSLLEFILLTLLSESFLGCCKTGLGLLLGRLGAVADRLYP